MVPGGPSWAPGLPSTASIENGVHSHPGIGECSFQGSHIQPTKSYINTRTYIYIYIYHIYIYIYIIYIYYIYHIYIYDIYHIYILYMWYFIHTVFVHMKIIEYTPIHLLTCTCIHPYLKLDFCTYPFLPILNLSMYLCICCYLYLLMLYVYI